MIILSAWASTIYIFISLSELSIYLYKLERAKNMILQIMWIVVVSEDCYMGQKYTPSTKTWHEETLKCQNRSKMDHLSVTPAKI